MRVGMAAGGLEDDAEKDSGADVGDIDASAAKVLRLAKVLLELMDKFKVNG